VTVGWLIPNSTDEQLRARVDRHPLPPTLINLALALGASIVGIFYLAMGLVLVWPRMVDRTWIGMGVLAASVVVVAGIAFWARELKRLWIYPVIEIASGVALATQVATSKDPIIALLGFVGAVRLTLDGMVRLLKMRRAYARTRMRVAKA
jgi:hypothetical protein